MKALIYYLLYFVLWLITLIPLRFLYPVSDFLFAVIYYIAAYRKKTVYNNLGETFPDKSSDEIKRIARLFYHQLTDYFLEWMCSMQMGGREFDRRLHYKNPEILEEYFSKGKSVILLMGHYGNWEWTSRITKLSGYTILAIYKPLQNKYSDRFFKTLRGKFGVLSIPMESYVRVINTYRQTGTPVLVLTLADQRPQWGSLQNWIRFLNRDTPVITGPEKIARKYNMPVLFLSMDKVKRGYYEAEFQVISGEPDQLDNYEITRAYFRKMETLIRRKPELWLWSHNRWKYHRDEVQNPVDINQSTS